MYKPQWPLFFIKAPTRFMILGVTMMLFMIMATLYGEGLRREKLEKIAQQPSSESTIPVPVPVPAPEKAATPAVK
jgi:hypothetical protein